MIDFDASTKYSPVEGSQGLDRRLPRSRHQQGRTARFKKFRVPTIPRDH